MFRKHQCRKERPGLETGLTLAQWDELYGKPAHERFIRKLKRVTISFGSLFLVPLAAILLITYGSHAVPAWVRSATAGAAAMTFGGFVTCCGLLAMLWAVERYGDRPTSGIARSRAHRGKYKRGRA